MPIWLRTFTFNKMKEYYENQSSQKEKAEESWINKNSEVAKAAKINIPDFAKKSSPKRSASYAPTSTKK